MITIARIHTDFSSKFGIPRQSGLVPSLTAKIVFEPQFQNPDFILGIGEFSHLWLLWDFSLSHRENISPTVYPPRLGGKEKRGVFATRSPFRPNSIALSCVKLEAVQYENDIPSLIVSGADILDNTPIYDIKPYLPYTDCSPSASGGFADEHKHDKLAVIFPS
ncbi:MAG: tRNA (N6-threonylcarbamoyladenosine(37)-N6)-methyltransferase TrmO, partial [Clostridia bacterium]|nr:tRNA (N6-threonylcarbamoyladenosine(37)-N6)-methyltransferase TrmO [Clostridia bacterium]